MSERYGDVETRVLLAEMAGRTTVRSLSVGIGVGTGRIQEALWRLRAAGLVTWEIGRQGTRRPLVKVVALR